MGNEFDVSRRAFLRGGALVVTFSLLPIGQVLADTEVDTGRGEVAGTSGTCG